MPIKRIENIDIQVEDITRAITFFQTLGMELLGETVVKGDWYDRLLGLDQVESYVALLGTSDGGIKIELSSFTHPKTPITDLQIKSVYTPGKHRIMFVVEDVYDTVDRLEKIGGVLVGEIVQYENSYLLCFLHGPEGILLSLVEEIH